MTRPIIEVENISKRYRLGQFNARSLREEAERLFRRRRSNGKDDGASGPANESEFWALKDVSFSVQPGEVIGIIGRNGGGKSTLLKIVSRVTEPTSGEIRIRGRVASLLEVGTGFHPELTGRENIFLNGAILGMTRAEIKTKFDEIIAFAEVERFLDTPVKRYSSGMYVRLAFAVAAHLEPEILIVDEVLAVGDGEFQKKCLGKMRDISCGGRTILFVSHNLDAIKTLCDRAILLEAGQLKSDLPPAEAIAVYLYRDYARNVVTFDTCHAGPSISRAEVDQAEALNGNLIVRIDFKSPEVISPVVPGLVLYDEVGHPIYGSNPRIHPEGFVLRNLNEGVVRFEARDLPIAEGTYLLSLWLGDWHQDYDYKAHILSLDFRPRNPPPRLLPSAEVGPLNWAARWRAEV